MLPLIYKGTLVDHHSGLKHSRHLYIKIFDGNRLLVFKLDNLITLLDRGKKLMLQMAGTKLMIKSCKQELNIQ